MPRSAPFADKLKRIVEGIPDLKVEGTLIYCTVCEKHLMGWHKSHCYEHIRRKCHQNNKQRGIPKSQFFKDLCMMLCACNLSFRVLDNPYLRVFWKRYIPQWEIPSSSFIGKTYVPRVYNTVMSNIKAAVKNKYVYVTVDETADQQLNEVIHVLVRCLELNSVTPPYLISSKRVERTTIATIVDLVASALDNVGITADKVLLCVTDSASYMENAGNELRKRFPNMIHVSCFARALHRVAKEVSKHYDEVEKFVYATGNVFSKSDDQKRAFLESVPGVPVPPEFVYGRWGTWIECVVHYSKHFDKIKALILTLNPSDSEDVASSQRYVQDFSIIRDMQTISKQFNIIPNAIAKLENESLALKDTIAVIDSVKEALSAYTDDPSIAIQQELQSILDSNPGYGTMLRIHSDLTNTINRGANSKNFYSYAPLTSVDVERSFSTYKSILRPNRMRLSERTIESILVVMYYYHSFGPPLQ